MSTAVNVNIESGLSVCPSAATIHIVYLSVPLTHLICLVLLVPNFGHIVHGRVLF